MKQTTPPNARTSPLILTPRDEQMLRAIYQYRYMTSLDMAHLLFTEHCMQNLTFGFRARARSAQLSGENLSWRCDGQ